MSMSRTFGPERLVAPHRAGLLDGPPEEAFNRLVNTVSEVTVAPVALVPFVGEGRQFLKCAADPAAVLKAEQDTPLALSSCRYVAASPEPLVLPDRAVIPTSGCIPRFKTGRWPPGPAPTILADTQAIGTVCVLDSRPR